MKIGQIQELDKPDPIPLGSNHITVQKGSMFICLIIKLCSTLSMEKTNSRLQTYSRPTANNEGTVE